jgi:hypothetical protein
VPLSSPVLRAPDPPGLPQDRDLPDHRLNQPPRRSGRAKRSLSAKVSNSEFDGLYELARAAVAIGGKLAGAGIKPGVNVGVTDEFGFSPVEDRVHVHDLQATILHLLGLDHKKLTYRFQGRDFRLTDVHGEVVKKLLV